MARATAHDSDTWWVLIPPSDSGKPASYLDKVDFRVNIGPSDPDYQLLQARRQINWGGMPLVYWKGPYATESAAKAAQNPTAAPNPTTDALTGIDAVGSFADRLTEASTWLRVGEFAVGAILLYIGLKSMFPQAVASATAPLKKTADVAKIAAVA
jgi:hypothetical protein